MSTIKNSLEAIHKQSTLALRALAVCVFAAMRVHAGPAIYNGPGNGIDVPVAIVTDSQGNVIVTGYSATNQDALAYKDIVTVKYSPQGTQKWAMRYDGPDHLDDIPRAITVDASDNIYVTGMSRNRGISLNFNDSAYVTIRYHAANGLFDPGIQDWVARYDSPGRGNDEAVALAVDYTGRLFVTGTSDPYGSNSPNITTLRYNPANGARVGDPAEYDSPGLSYARAMGTDRSGHVYVAGMRWTGNGAGYDFVTIQYDASTLAESWSVPFDGSGLNDDPVALKVNGNRIYVTGSSWTANSGEVMMTLKYDSFGNLLWSQPADRDQRAGGYDHPVAMALDSAGNIYVTGYSNAGSLPNGLPNLDFIAVKYTPDGVPDKVWLYDGGNGSDIPSGIGIDGSDHVYITGSSIGPNGQQSDYVTMRLDPNGFLYRWTQRYNSADNGNDYARAMAVTNSGYVYVTGRSPVAGQADNFLTLKYKFDGTQLW